MLPVLYIFLVAIAFFAIIGLYQKRYHKKLLFLFGSEVIPRNAFSKLKLLKLGLLFLGFLVTLLAIYMPYKRVVPQQFSVPSKKLILVMDTSQSLGIQKSDQNTWFSFSASLAQGVLSYLDSSIQSSVIQHSSSASLIAPSSLDVDFSQLAIQNLFVGSQAQSRKKKNSLFTLIDSISKRGSHTLVLIFSDGHSLPLISPKTVANLKKKSVKIVFIGLGDLVSSPIPILNHRGERVDYVKTASGGTRLSAQNTEGLKTLASTVGGLYLPVLKSHKRDDRIRFLLEQVMSQYHQQMVNEMNAQKKPFYPLYLLFIFIVLVFEELIIIRKGRLK